jgi:hypothetical protein
MLKKTIAYNLSSYVLPVLGMTSNRVIPLYDTVLYWIDELERRQAELGIKSDFNDRSRKT